MDSVAKFFVLERGDTKLYQYATDIATTPTEVFDFRVSCNSCGACCVVHDV